MPRPRRGNRRRSFVFSEYEALDVVRGTLRICPHVVATKGKEHDDEEALSAYACSSLKVTRAELFTSVLPLSLSLSCRYVAYS